jgi:putative ABC transport system permease protein
MNLVRLALGNLRRRPGRTVLTAAAISLGVAAVVALTSIAWGFETSWQQANDARGTDLIVTRVASENGMPSSFPASKLQGTLKAYPHVQEVVGLLSEMLSIGDSGPPVFVFGWAYDSYLWKHLRLLDGKWPDNEIEPVVMIGSLAAEVLKSRTGDALEIEGRKFRVAGIFESAAVVESGALLMTLAQAQQISDKPGKVNVLNIRLDAHASDADIADFKARVRQAAPGFVAVTSGELVQKNAVVRISKAMSSATILIASLVAALVVFNTMLMSVTERTREIGLLLALGWQRRTVMSLIFGESMMLALLGGLLGILLGIAMAWGLERLDLMHGKIAPVFSASFFASVVGLSVLIGACGGLLPALKAARMLPAHALRQE